MVMRGMVSSPLVRFYNDHLFRLFAPQGIHTRQRLAFEPFEEGAACG